MALGCMKKTFGETAIDIFLPTEPVPPLTRVKLKHWTSSVFRLWGSLEAKELLKELGDTWDAEVVVRALDTLAMLEPPYVWNGTHPEKAAPIQERWVNMIGSPVKPNGINVKYEIDKEHLRAIRGKRMKEAAKKADELREHAKLADEAAKKAKRESDALAKLLKEAEGEKGKS